MSDFNYQRITKTLCPLCSKELMGEVVISGHKVLLQRHCPEHGSSSFLLSEHGEEYAKLDYFYFHVLKKNKLRGKITNDWIFVSNSCNMNCAYCAVDIERPLFENMSRSEIEEVLKKYKKHKLTITGGEPTLHPDIFYFFELGKKLHITTQLAINGVLLADEEFLKKLIDSGMYELRLSTEAFHIEDASKLKTQAFMSKKIQALQLLEKYGVKTILSPTLFKGINEAHLDECMQYALEHPFIAEISINGFTWAGGGTALDKEAMYMPDLIMDKLHKNYLTCPREEVFTFQKFMQLTLQLFNIRLCMNTQLLIFVRHHRKYKHLTDYFNMKRLSKKMNHWHKYSNQPTIIQWLIYLLIVLTSLRWSLFTLLMPLFRMMIANMFQVKIFKYPNKLLPVVINTTCSVLNADADTIRQCMSGMLIKEKGQIVYSKATELIYKIDKSKKNLLSS